MAARLFFAALSLAAVLAVPETFTDETFDAAVASGDTFLVKVGGGDAGRGVPGQGGGTG